MTARGSTRIGELGGIDTGPCETAEPVSLEPPFPLLTPRRGVLVAAVAALALFGAACNADGPDAYTADALVTAESEIVSEDTEELFPEEESGEAEPEEMEAGSEEMEDDSGEDQSAETVPPNGEVLNVRSLDNSFIDEVVEVEAGTEILWTNNGRNEHNVVPVDESEMWGIETVDFQPGDEYSRVFDTPGEYPYYCSIHGTSEVGMIGTIVVTG